MTSNPTSIAVTPASNARRRLTSVERSLLKLKSGGKGGRAKADDEWDLPGLGLKHAAETPALGKRVRRKTSKALALDVSAAPAIKLTPPVRESGPPQPKRSIVDNKGLNDCIKEGALCKGCRKGTLDLSFPSTCIATRPTLRCLNCHVTVEAVPAPAAIGGAKRTAHGRNVDCAVNVQCALAFMACGDGGSEAQKILGLLDLPNATTMEKNSFSKIEQSVAPSVAGLAKEMMVENLLLEVKLTAEDVGNSDYTLGQCERWKQARSTGVKPSIDDYPRLTVSMDMGWNGRGSGRSHNSNSGFACAVGAYTRKAISNDLKNRYCKICSLHAFRQEKNESSLPKRRHDCPINHSDTSASVEAAALLDMAHDLWDRECVIFSRIVTDDDSSMKSQMKWSNADYVSHYNLPKVPVITTKTNTLKKRKGGKLRHPYPQPTFLADPGHRKKTLKGHVHKLLNKTKAYSLGITSVDILRVSTNFAYMTNVLPTLDRSKWQSACKAVIEHHFDHHSFCGDFCTRKDLSEEERAASDKFFRCELRDADLCDFLTDLVGQCTTDAKLNEVGHGMDTNINESLNSVVSWIAPKAKTYGGSVSLQTRIYIAIGIHLVGFETFFSRLLTRMGIAVTEGVAYYLAMQSRHRGRRIKKAKLAKTKQRRQKRQHEQLKAATQRPQEARRKELGVCKPGVQCSVAVTPTDTVRVCTACEEVGHLRPWNKLCRFCVPRVRKTAKEVPESSCQSKTIVLEKDLVEDGEEQEMLDSLSFDVSGQLTADHLDVLLEVTSKESTDDTSDIDTDTE